MHLQPFKYWETMTSMHIMCFGCLFFSHWKYLRFVEFRGVEPAAWRSGDTWSHSFGRVENSNFYFDQIKRLTLTMFDISTLKLLKILSPGGLNLTYSYRIYMWKWWWIHSHSSTCKWLQSCISCALVSFSAHIESMWGFLGFRGLNPLLEDSGLSNWPITSNLIELCGYSWTILRIPTAL